MEPVLQHTGRWQILLLVLIGSTYAIVAYNHALPTFHGYTPSYHCCLLTDEGNVTRVNGCVTQGDECVDGYQFESPRDENSIVTEWGLVCDRRILWPLTTTLYFCGVTIGALVCGMLADRFGRKPVMLICLYSQGALGLALYVAYSLEAYIAVRFVQGFFVQGLQGSTYTLLMELFPHSARTAVGIVLEMYWAFGLILLAGLAYALPNWRYLQLALTVPTILTLLYVCIVPESPCWLTTRGRHEAAAALVQKISRRNGNKQHTSTNQASEKRPLGDDHSESGSDIKESLSSRSGKQDCKHENIKTVGELSPVKTESGAFQSEMLNSEVVLKEEEKSRLSNGVDVRFAPISTEQDILNVSTKLKTIENYSDVELNQEENTADGISCLSRTFENVGDTSLEPCVAKNVCKESIVVNGKNGACIELAGTTSIKYGILDLFRSKVLRKYNFIMVFNWFSISLTYYGIMFYLPDLSGDRHLNFVLGAVLEAVSYGAAYFVLVRYGRRVPLAVYLVSSGILCVAVGAISMLQGATTGSLAGLQTGLALLGKAAVVSAFCSIFLYTSELFPTVVRAAAMGYCGLWGRVGSLLSPQLLLLGENTSKIVPMVTMGALVILAGCTTLLLPETLGSPLANTIEEAEEMQENRIGNNKRAKN